MKKNNRTLLVITFFDRKETLKKQLEFLEGYNQDIDTVIVDQSEDTWAQTIQHHKIKAVHHYPASQYHFYKMWQQICDLYKDYSFIYWNNDDDFASPKGIKIAEQFLLENPEYSVAQGQVIQMQTYNAINWGYGTSEWFKKDKKDKNILQRIENIFRPSVYVNPHILTRMEVWSKAINIVCESLKGDASLGPIRFWDKIFTMVAACEGYRKTNLNCISLIRLHRNLSGAVTLNNPEVSPILERNTQYDAIFDRLKEHNPIASMLYGEKGIDLDLAHQTTVSALRMKDSNFKIDDNIIQKTPVFENQEEFRTLIGLLNQ
tara:strand:+ start:20439 stop:21392 length:954 start_codon:yes stop_codon:yes gene_type:complete